MRTSDEETKYIVYVMWTAGLSQKAIAMLTSLRKGKVVRIVQASEYSGRSEMSDAARRRAFDELMAVRRLAGHPALDGGFFDRIKIEFQPLTGRQRIAVRRWGRVSSCRQ